MHALIGWPAHGIGGSEDLPLPLGWAVAGAAAAVVVSFVALGVGWRTPRVDGDRAGWPVPALVVLLLDSVWARWAQAGLGVLAALYVLPAAVFGWDDTRNPLPWVVYVLLWVGLVPVSLVLGPVWRRVNPVRTVHALLHRALGLDPAVGVLPLPRQWGYWPAAIGLFAFTWLELVSQTSTEMATLRLAIAVYLVAQVFAGVLFGSGWYDRGDPFEVWSGLFGRLSALGRRKDGLVVVRSPLAGLDRLTPAPGLVATVCVMLGSTAYDGLSGTSWWTVRTQESASPTLVRTAGLLGTILVIAIAYSACTWAAGVIGSVGSTDNAGPSPEPDSDRRAWSATTMPAWFAASVVPVALGYVVAHYYSFLVVEGQRAFIKLSDPWGMDADVLGTGTLQPSYALVTPSIVVAVQVAAIVVGHILGVVVAHERAVQLFPPSRAVVGQLPLLALMVGLTTTGLLLLFAG